MRPTVDQQVPPASSRGATDAQSTLSLLRRAVAATTRHSATQFTWFGKLSADAQAHVRPIFALRPGTARDYLLGTLVNHLYENVYQAGQAKPARPAYAGSARAGGLPAFVDALSAANTGSGTRQEGWIIIEHRHGDDGAVELAIRRDGLTLRARPDEIADSRGGAPGVGDEVGLRLPKELPAVSPGFYTALSDAPYDAAGHQVVRLYWNLYPWGAAALVRGITLRLNAAKLPFRLKLVDHPDRYTRCDAGVLYLLRDQLDEAVPLLAGVYREIGGDLKRPVPALTKRIAPGVGLAEDPAEGDSFGMHRCRLLAEGLVRGWERGATSVDERLAVVLETFEQAGIDPERPYLNPGSASDYDFVVEAFASQTTGTADRASPASTQPYAERDYLDVAAAIGREIIKEAFWHEGWCNWLGVAPRDPNAPAHQGMTYRSLGPEPYEGSSGVALFLAELAVATGDNGARETALGAIRGALGRADVIAPPVQLGFFTGRPGLALAAGRVGKLLGAEDVTDGARALLDRLDVDLARPHEHDLLSGAAGGLLALLRLSELPGELALVGRAAALGERLLAAAECDERGCSWPSVVAPATPNLTGYSHGAAGIGMALLELWQATGEQRFRDIATRAFDFERSWFDATEGNWPDFRAVDDLAARPNGPFPYATAWCHGAPGIALSRLRAWKLTGDERYRDEALAALQTTHAAIITALDDGTLNYSLCHGLAGNAEILMLGAERLGAGYEHFAAAARDVAAAGIELYAPAGRDWANGAHGGWTPGLMLGLAGIGRFYLRLARPALPSILLPGKLP